MRHNCSQSRPKSLVSPIVCLPGRLLYSRARLARTLWFPTALDGLFSSDQLRFTHCMVRPLEVNADCCWSVTTAIAEHHMAPRVHFFLVFDVPPVSFVTLAHKLNQLKCYTLSFPCFAVSSIRHYWILFWRLVNHWMNWDATPPHPFFALTYARYHGLISHCRHTRPQLHYNHKHIFGQRWFGINANRYIYGESVKSHTLCTLLHASPPTANYECNMEYCKLSLGYVGQWDIFGCLVWFSHIRNYYCCSWVFCSDHSAQ